MIQIIEEGRRFASAADLKVSDMSANSPVGTTLAILERTLKVMSAVQARIHYAMKQEFKLLKNIIRDYTDDEYGYEPDNGDEYVKKSDYDMVEVIPVSDPNAATMSQKVVQYQAVIQLAQSNPDIYDMVELNKQMLEVLGVKNIEKLIPNTEDMKPTDPISENMNIINLKPVKAFEYQDHQAHLDVHLAFADDPKIKQLVGQSPKAGEVQAALDAHVAEHLAFLYRRQIEEQLGVPLPKPNEVLPEDAELEVSRLVARAAQQLLGKNQQEIAQQEAAAQAQDPLTQIQQRELAIKEQEAQAKAQKMMADAQLEQAKFQQELQARTQEMQTTAEIERAKLELEKMRIDSQERIAGAKLGAEAVLKDKQLKSSELMQGAKLGVDVVQQDKQLEANKKRKD